MDQTQPKQGRPPGIKIRIGTDGRLRLLDRKTGKLLASVSWLPRGKVSVELADEVRKEVLEKDMDNSLVKRRTKSG